MQQAKSYVVGLLVSFSCALTSPTSAQVGTVSGSGSLANQAPSAFTEQIGHYETSVDFGGQHLSWAHVMRLAKDPVLSWGAVQDEHGRWVDGEVWMIVLRAKKFIYFHLTDTPNTAQDTTSYSGYTVKIKAPMSVQFYGVGSGGIVPLIGNATDTFLVTTTEMLVNSRFTEGEVQKFDIRTGAEIPYLIHLYNEVRSYGVSSIGTRIALAIQYFSPDGVELIAPFHHTYAASATSTYSATCNQAGELVSDGIDALTDIAETVETIEATQIFVHSFSPPLFVNYISPIVVASTWSGIHGAREARQFTDNVVAPMAAALAEGVCESLTQPDVLPPIVVEFPSQDLKASLVAVALVCDKVESQYTGSTHSVEDDGNITVVGHTENICTEWHYEVVS